MTASRLVHPYSYAIRARQNSTIHALSPSLYGLTGRRGTRPPPPRLRTTASLKLVGMPFGRIGDGVAALGNVLACAGNGVASRQKDRAQQQQECGESRHRFLPRRTYAYVVPRSKRCAHGGGWSASHASAKTYDESRYPLRSVRARMDRPRGRRYRAARPRRRSALSCPVARRAAARRARSARAVSADAVRARAARCSARRGRQLRSAVRTRSGDLACADARHGGRTAAPREHVSFDRPVSTRSRASIGACVSLSHASAELGRGRAALRCAARDCGIARSRRQSSDRPCGA